VFEKKKAQPSGMQGHMDFLRELVVQVNAQQVVELGVWTGNSTIAFLAGLEETGGKLWSVDKEAPQTDAASLLGKPNWVFHQGDDRESLQQAPEQCDILLCDMTNDYDTVSWQLENYGARVRDGGYILVHDTEIASTQRAIMDYLKGKNWRYGERPESHGMGVIEVGGTKSVTQHYVSFGRSKVYHVADGKTTACRKKLNKARQVESTRGMKLCAKCK